MEHDRIYMEGFVLTVRFERVAPLHIVVGGPIENSTQSDVMGEQGRGRQLYMWAYMQA